MNRRRLWWGAVAATAGLVALTGWLPDHRLQAEIAAARAEGVPLDATAALRRIPPVLPADNAAPLIDAATTADLALRHDDHALALALDGLAKAAVPQIAAARAGLRRHPEILARWRAAASRPKLDFGRDWGRGYDLSFQNVARVRMAGLWLAGAARLGIDPEANLVAAARLSALLHQEPVTISHLASIKIGREVLSVAAPLHLARRVEREMGPPIDPRWSLLFAPAGTMALFQAIDADRDGGPTGPKAWFGKLRVVRANAAWRAVHGWRLLWRELPKDPQDYAGAAAALDRRMGGVDEALVDDSLGRVSAGGPHDAGDAVRAYASFEAERRSARQGP